MPQPVPTILLVRGTWGDVSRKEADQITDLVAEHLRKLQRKDTQTGEMIPRVNVEVVENETEARTRLFRQPRIKTVVFCSRGLVEAARRTKQEFKTTSVVVFTGLVPDDEILFVRKTWDPETCDDIFING